MSYHERARDRRRHARDRLLDERRSRDERHPLEQRHPFDEDPSRRRRRDRHNEDRERRRSRERLRGPTSERRDPLLDRSRYHDEGDFFPAADYRGNITSTSAAERALEAAAGLTAPSMRRSDRYRPSNRDFQLFDDRDTPGGYSEELALGEDERQSYRRTARDDPPHRGSPPRDRREEPRAPEDFRFVGQRMNNPQAHMLLGAKPLPGFVGTPRPSEELDDMIEYVPAPPASSRRRR